MVKFHTKNICNNSQNHKFARRRVRVFPSARRQKTENTLTPPTFKTIETPSTDLGVAHFVTRAG
jgi:hypothetical protein